MEAVVPAGTVELCACGAELPPKTSGLGRPRLKCDFCRKAVHKAANARLYASKRPRVQNEEEEIDGTPSLDEGHMTRRRLGDASEPPAIHFADTPVLVLKMTWGYSSLQLETLQSFLKATTWHDLQGEKAPAGSLKICQGQTPSYTAS